MTHSIIHERRGEREVKKFAEAMIEKLNEPKNLEKGGWKDSFIDFLFHRLKEETIELQEELKQKMSCYVSVQDRKEKVLKECADVANFAMMIADKVGALE